MAPLCESRQPVGGTINRLSSSALTRQAGAPRWAFWAVAALAVDVATVQETAAASSSSFSAGQASRILLELQDFMGLPEQAIAAIQPMFDLGVAEISSREEILSSVYSQVIALDVGHSDPTLSMLYAGMSDGRFLGYYDDETMVIRAAGAGSGSDLPWPHALTESTAAALASLNELCAAAAATGSNMRCGGGGSRTVSVSCPAGPPDSTVVGRPACVNVSADSSCCHESIEGVYTTSRAEGGHPITTNGWVVYDPRLRPWYIGEVTRYHAGAYAVHDSNRITKMAWSSIYSFVSSGGGQLGITASGPLEVDGSLVGVVAADYTLSSLAPMLQAELQGNSWVYVVETNSAKLLVSVRSHGLTGQPAELWTDATQSSDGSIAASAALLSANGWLEMAVLNMSSSTGYEAQSRRFTDVVGSIDWLVVVGQDIRCLPEREIWNSARGVCEVCPPGSAPNISTAGIVSAVCTPCMPGHAGSSGACLLCADGSQPNEAASACVRCPSETAGRAGECL